MVITEQHLIPCAERMLDVLTLRPEAPGRHAVALLVAGSRSGAEVWASWGKRLAERGVAVVGVAQPGFGRSSGPWDFAGAPTMAALESLLMWTRRQRWVKPLQIGLGGYSSGATCACLLATRLHCRVLVGAAGVYNLADWWDHVQERSSWALEQLDPTVTPADLHARSPHHLAGHISCPVRLVHGANDDVVPVAQAEQMAQALADAGNAPELIVEPQRGHSSLQAAPFIEGLVRYLVQQEG